MRTYRAFCNHCLWSSESLDSDDEGRMALADHLEDAHPLRALGGDDGGVDETAYAD